MTKIKSNPIQKGKSNLKAKIKIQKGGNIEGNINYGGNEISICSNSTVIFIIVVFLLIIAGMYIYFTYYYVPHTTHSPSQSQQPKMITKENMNEDEPRNQKVIVVQQPPLQPPSEVQYLVDKEQERLVNPLLPPERSYVLTNGGGLPFYPPSQSSINVTTRGFTGAFQQIGLLYKKDPSGENNNEGNILPLYGRPTNTNRDKWYYYTTSDKFHSLKIPLKIKGRLSNDEWGSNELYDDDTVEVGPYNGQFKVQIYGYDSPKYLPQLW
jgi:hypothetical protein